MSEDVRALPVYAAGAIEVPFVIEGFDERVDRETRWAEHSHPTHELLWNERGISRVSVGQRTWTISAALGLWIPAGVLHSGVASAGTWYRTSHFGVDSVESISSRPAAVEVTPLLRQLLDRLSDATLSPRSRSVTEAVVLDVLAPSHRELFVQVPESALLAPIVSAVQEDPGAVPSLSSWAERLGVSTRTITRAFRAETGVGFLGWIATVRAQRAVDLLSRGEAVEEVSAELGYSSPSAFGAAFRRTTGFTPSAFRSR